MQTQPSKYEYEIGYTCGGCSKAVDRILGKLKDPNGGNGFMAWHVPDWEQKRAYVWFEASQDQGQVQAMIEEKLQKWSDASQKPFKFIGVTQEDVGPDAKKPE